MPKPPAPPVFIRHFDAEIVNSSDGITMSCGLNGQTIAAVSKAQNDTLRINCEIDIPLFQWFLKNERSFPKDGRALAQLMQKWMQDGLCKALNAAAPELLREIDALNINHPTQRRFVKPQ